MNSPLPDGIGRGKRRCRSRISRGRTISVDYVVFLCESHSIRIADLMAYQHEHQGARPPQLEFHVHDSRDAGDGLADSQGVMKFQTAARPHASRQRNRRQESAPLGVTIWAKGGVTMDRQE